MVQKSIAGEIAAGECVAPDTSKLSPADRDDLERLVALGEQGGDPLMALGQIEFDALLREHQRWNDGEGGGRLDLTGHVLMGLRLAGRRVDGAVLNGADLSGCDLTGVDLSHAELIGATLRRATLRSADLCKANLTGADLGGADLTGARLLRTDLTEAVLADAVLDRADLTKTFFSRTDLRNAKLRHATFDRVGFDADPVSGWDATGATGTVLAGSLVTDASGLADAIEALRHAGALVRPFVRKVQA
ncbi:pentapeptide repeat-containing protein [Actinokineospora spheciospongiae]|uniref:pentapeptide repeat-containing protein n=1 Tax=Actinokineospora spheciospongiae TaxID=909613 RepID=UPI000D71642A|nr:pentapeptide repeat-containing protein [Actinokineospora spheciospongiae]PWW58353.1 uncharacterized protein YjbI with pentapeptide repeats [Actinokineospora spheciospongiae]